MLSSGLKSFIGAPTFVRKKLSTLWSAGSVVGSKAHRIRGPQVKLFDAGIMIALCEYTQFYYKGQKIGFCILDTKVERVTFLVTKINCILNEHSFTVISTTLHIKLVVAYATQALMVVSVVKPQCQVQVDR